MKRIDYVKIFAFLAFLGSAFLSTVFHYPAFTIFWFIPMLVSIGKLSEESSELIILAFVALAYIPLGLTAALSSYVDRTVDNTGLSPFAWFLVALVIVEIILSLSWVFRKNESK